MSYAPFDIQYLLGKLPDGDVFVDVVFNGERLSITGVIGPKSNGDCRGSAGQITNSLREIIVFAAGWDRESVTKLAEIWDRWHLNDMRAGSPAQRAWLDENFEGHRDYVAVSAALAEAGLNPDPSFEYNGAPYKYGHAWLSEEVPADVLDWLSGRQPAARVSPWGPAVLR